MAAITPPTFAPLTAPSSSGPAPAPGMTALLRAVRRRLRLRQFAAAARAAAWTTAAVMPAAAAVHGAVLSLAPVSLLAALGVVWSVWLVRAAWQRPPDRACALWADQHLGGESAFTTCLDTGGAARGQAPSSAARWLAAWTEARVPASLQQLAAQREPARLMRPLLAMAVCSALTGLVLTLPGLTPAPPTPAGARPNAAAPDAAPRLGDVPSPAALAGEIKSALRATSPRDADSPAARRRDAVAGSVPNDADAVPAVPAAPQSRPAPAGARSATLPTPAVPADASALPSAAAGQGAGAAGGRDAGDRSDTRAAPGLSRALRGTMQIRGAVPMSIRPSGQQQADSDQAGSYRGDEPEAGGGVSGRVQPRPVAATPPPASESMRLTPTEESYVQAWMKAGQRRP